MTDTDTFGRQPEPALTTEQVRALLETYEKAYWNLGEAMDSREPTPEHPGLVMTDWQRARRRQYQDALGAVGKAFPTLARDLLTERTAHAATRAELDAAQNCMLQHSGCAASSLLAENARLRAALAGAEAGGWIPVSERWPEEWKEVSLCLDGQKAVVGFRVGGKYFSPDERPLLNPPTHWQPLPPPPALATAQGKGVE